MMCWVPVFTTRPEVLVTLERVLPGLLRTAWLRFPPPRLPQAWLPGLHHVWCQPAAEQLIMCWCCEVWLLQHAALSEAAQQWSYHTPILD